MEIGEGKVTKMYHSWNKATVENFASIYTRSACNIGICKEQTRYDNGRKHGQREAVQTARNREESGNYG